MVVSSEGQPFFSRSTLDQILQAYNLIAVDEWLPDRDTLYRSVRRYTLRIDETLHRPKI
jgi:hypothetical protein